MSKVVWDAKVMIILACFPKVPTMPRRATWMAASLVTAVFVHLPCIIQGVKRAVVMECKVVAIVEIQHIGPSIAAGV